MARRTSVRVLLSKIRTTLWSRRALLLDGLRLIRGGEAVFEGVVLWPPGHLGRRGGANGGGWWWDQLCWHEAKHSLDPLLPWSQSPLSSLRTSHCSGPHLPLPGLQNNKGHLWTWAWCRTASLTMEELSERPSSVGSWYEKIEKQTKG